MYLGEAEEEEEAISPAVSDHPVIEDEKDEEEGSNEEDNIINHKEMKEVQHFKVDVSSKVINHLSIYPHVTCMIHVCTCFCYSLSICLSTGIYLSIYLSTYLPTYLPTYLLSIYLSVGLQVKGSKIIIAGLTMKKQHIYRINENTLKIIMFDKVTFHWICPL